MNEPPELPEITPKLAASALASPQDGFWKEADDQLNQMLGATQETQNAD